MCVLKDRFCTKKNCNGFGPRRVGIVHEVCVCVRLSSVCMHAYAPGILVEKQQCVGLICNLNYMHLLFKLLREAWSEQHHECVLPCDHLSVLHQHKAVVQCLYVM